MIGSFDSSQEDCLSCSALLQNQFVANDIIENKTTKCQAILLSVCLPVDQEFKPEVPYEDLIKLVVKQHNPEQFSISSSTSDTTNLRKLFVSML